MPGRLQKDPEEAWVFGFGSIIYKQGMVSCPALHGRHRPGQLDHNAAGVQALTFKGGWTVTLEAGGQSQALDYVQLYLVAESSVAFHRRGQPFLAM